MKILRIIFTPLLVFSVVASLFLIVYVADFRATVMDPAFVEKELMENVYPTVEQELKQELGDLISEGLTGQVEAEEAQIVSDAMKASITDEWAKTTAHNIISGFYDHLNSESSTLNLAIPLSAEFKAGLKEALEVYFTAEATGLNQEQVNAGLEAINQQVDNLPSELTLTVENLDLSPLQNTVVIFNYLFPILIALAVLLAVLLILLHFELKDATRVLGFCLLIGGVIILVAALVAISLLNNRVDTVDWPLSSINSDMVMTLIRDFLHPASIYSILLMAIGVVLIVFSFLLGRGIIGRLRVIFGHEQSSEIKS
jgi:hypothetical protein